MHSTSGQVRLAQRSLRSHRLSIYSHQGRSGTAACPKGSRYCPLSPPDGSTWLVTLENDMFIDRYGCSRPSTSRTTINRYAMYIR